MHGIYLIYAICWLVIDDGRYSKYNKWKVFARYINNKTQQQNLEVWETVTTTSKACSK